jgi:hypothetical protein
MSRARTLGALTALTAAVAPAAAASITSHAKFWQNKSGSVACGVKIHPKSKPATLVLCGARGIPRAKHGIGDPFVQIAAHGRPVLVLLSQDSFMGTATKLASGTTWTSLGVTCTIGAKTATCKNESKHGFTIGNGKYKPF